jgi:G:T-mismatch repair DNA endonuclease (very short patch repair protein)
MSYSNKLHRICAVCGTSISDTNKSGCCNKHRDRTGPNNPFYGKTHSKETVDAMIEKTRIASTEKWKDPDYRKKVIDGTSKPRKASFKGEQSLRILKWYEDHPEQRASRSKDMKRSWDLGLLQSEGFTGGSSSKIEKDLFSYLQIVFGNDVKKTSVKLENGKWLVPDSICLGSDVVELYGDFWHANPSKYAPTDIIHHGLTASEIWERDRKRIAALNDHGFRVSIVWESDFRKQKEKALSGIITMIDWEACSL